MTEDRGTGTAPGALRCAYCAEAIPGTPPQCPHCGRALTYSLLRPSPHESPASAIDMRRAARSSRARLVVTALLGIPLTVVIVVGALWLIDPPRPGESAWEGRFQLAPQAISILPDGAVLLATDGMLVATRDRVRAHYTIATSAGGGILDQTDGACEGSIEPGDTTARGTFAQEVPCEDVSGLATWTGDEWRIAISGMGVLRWRRVP